MDSNDNSWNAGYPTYIVGPIKHYHIPGGERLYKGLNRKQRPNYKRIIRTDERIEIVVHDYQMISRDFLGESEVEPLYG